MDRYEPRPGLQRADDGSFSPSTDCRQVQLGAGVVPLRRSYHCEAVPPVQSAHPASCHLRRLSSSARQPAALSSLGVGGRLGGCRLASTAQVRAARHFRTNGRSRCVARLVAFTQLLPGLQMVCACAAACSCRFLASMNLLAPQPGTGFPHAYSATRPAILLCSCSCQPFKPCCECAPVYAGNPWQSLPPQRRPPLPRRRRRPAMRRHAAMSAATAWRR